MNLLEGNLGVKRRGKRVFMDKVDISMILMIANIHEGIRIIAAFS